MMKRLGSCRRKNDAGIAPEGFGAPVTHGVAAVPVERVQIYESI